MILALTGGVGGAKLATGLAKILSNEELHIVVNTGDDFNYWGLPISPDIDTVMYNLAGVNNTSLGWGIEDEKWTILEGMEKMKVDNWFRIGDRDLLTHLHRAQLLNDGHSLTSATDIICNKYGVHHSIIPMTDNPIHTLLHTKKDTIVFQDYFVKQKCKPIIHSISYQGCDDSMPSAKLMTLIDNPSLKGIVICPSNPFLSIAPILSIPLLRKKLQSMSVPIIAVSPLINGQAIKGPTSKIMYELGVDVSNFGIASFYSDIISGIVIDASDSSDKMKLKKQGINVFTTNTLMKSNTDKVKLAKSVLSYLGV